MRSGSGLPGKVGWSLKRWIVARERGRHIRMYQRQEKSGRNSLARNIDFWGPVLIMAAVTFLAAVVYTGNPVTALWSLPIIALIVAVSWGMRKKLHAIDGARRGIRLAGRGCLETLKEISSRKEINSLVGEILSSLPEFRDVHAVEDGESGDSLLPLRALYMGYPVAVQCRLPSGGEPMPASEVHLFADGIRKASLTRGILVTTGIIAWEARKAAMAEKGIRIALVDAYRLVELARSSGHEIFRTGRTGEIKKERAERSRLLAVALDRKKAAGYLACAALLYAFCQVVDVGAAYFVFIAFAVANAVLSAYCFLMGIREDMAIDQL